MQRVPLGPKLDHALDRVVEGTSQGNMPYPVVFITLLWATGVAMPLNYLLFNGELRDTPVIALVALVFKLLSVIGMMVTMFVIFLRLSPRLRELFATFSPDADPDPDGEREFFAVRARRKYLCEICLGFAVSVLVFSALLGFEA